MLIVTASDNNYVAGVLVLIASAAYHNPDASFAVLDMGISSENRKRIDFLAAKLKRKISRLEVAGNTFDHLVVKNTHITRSTYLRLLIPDLFPDLDRVLYMDCDMLVLGDLSFLWNLDLTGNLVAAAPCPVPNSDELAVTNMSLGTYINAGLLVMNLPAWRSESISQKCVDVVQDQAIKIRFEDQSAINIVAKGRIQMLETRFNLYAPPDCHTSVEAIPMDCAVLHYTGKKKPWVDQNHLYRVWKFHADRINDIMPPRSKISVKQWISFVNRERKYALGAILGKKRHRQRNLNASFLNSTFTEEYLRRVTEETKLN